MTIFVLYDSHKGRAVEKMLDSAMTGGLKIAILRMCQGQMWPDWEPPRLSQQDVTFDIQLMPLSANPTLPNESRTILKETISNILHASYLKATG